MAQLPDTVGDQGVLVAGDGEGGEVGASVGGPVLAQLAGRDQPAERVEELDVEQVGGGEVAVGGQPFQQLSGRRAAGEGADDRGGVDDQHGIPVHSPPNRRFSMMRSAIFTGCTRESSTGVP